MERYLSFTLELSVMIFCVFLDDLLRMENKSFHNSLNFAHISDLVTTKKHSGCLIVSKFDFISLVLPSYDSTNASCSFDKPGNGSLISMHLSKISGKSVLPLQTTVLDKKLYSTNMLSWFRISGISAITDCIINCMTINYVTYNATVGVLWLVVDPLFNATIFEPYKIYI